MATNPEDRTHSDSDNHGQDQEDTPPAGKQVKKPVGCEQAAINREDDPPA
ncbi:MAG: hypothetical protein ACR2MN_01355 [Acidimicrobiales bacterium]